MLNAAGAEGFQRLLARRDRHGVEALAAQEGIQQAALPGIVIDDQDARAF